MNRNPLLVSGLLIIGCLLLAVAPFNPSLAEQARRSRPVFINLTAGSDDMQKATTALMLADNARQAGHHVTLYLNVRGVELADKSNRIPLFKRRTMAQGSIETMIQNGLEVYVCPYSLKMAGLNEDQLIDGVMVAPDESYFPELPEGAAVFSY